MMLWKHPRSSPRRQKKNLTLVFVDSVVVSACVSLQREAQRRDFLSKIIKHQQFKLQLWLSCQHTPPDLYKHMQAVVINLPLDACYLSATVFIHVPTGKQQETSKLAAYMLKMVSSSQTGCVEITQPTNMLPDDIYVITSWGIHKLYIFAAYCFYHITSIHSLCQINVMCPINLIFPIIF